MKRVVKTVDYIDETLNDMVARPAFWGPLPCVELQVIRLLEVRMLLRCPEMEDTNPSLVSKQYWEMLRETFPDSDPVSLRTRVKGDAREFAKYLSDFCSAQRKAQDIAAVEVALLASDASDGAANVRPYGNAPSEDHFDRSVEQGDSRLPYTQ